MSQTTMFDPAPKPVDSESWDELIRRDRAVKDRMRALKKQFHSELDDGATCPTCQRFGKRYKRKLGGQQVVWLMWLVQEFERTGGWVCIQDTAHWARYKGGIVGGDYGKLIHWGLITPHVNDDPSKKSSGYWKPTQRGIDFVHRRIKVPSHVYLYNNAVHGWSDINVKIGECLGIKFDYSSLMGHTGNM